MAIKLEGASGPQAAPAPGAAALLTTDLAQAMLTPCAMHDPAPLRLWAQIHEALAETGEVPRLDEMPAFALERRDETGAIRAALAGEVIREAMHVSHLWVDPAYRRHGLGGELLSTAEAHGAGCGVRRVHLETRSDYGRRFYEKRGYVVCGEMKQYSGEQSLYFMEKLFSPLT